jgi:gliding motility-associated-like protein
MLNSYKIFKLFSLSQKLRSKPVFFIFLFFTITTLKAQENLVPNGSFEEYNNCPSFANGFYIDACKYWTSPTLASPDYFNACSTDFDVTLNQYNFSVPQNYYGNMPAKHGQAYAACVYAQDSDTSRAYTEYIQVKLKKKLIVNQMYTLKFYLNNQPQDCINSIGALFTSMELNLNHDSVIQMIPQYQSDTTIFFCDTTKWYEHSYSFVSDGTEEYLTLGVFTVVPTTKNMDYFGNINSDFIAGTYLYIDDVSLYGPDEEDTDLLIQNALSTNVFTPNSDGTNDLFDLSSFSDQISSLTIVNRWQNIIYCSENNFVWDGKSKGVDCADGVYFYVIEFKNKNKKHGFLTLMR